MFASDLLRAPGDGLPSGAPRILALITIAFISLSVWVNLAVTLLGARDPVGAIGTVVSVAGVLSSFRDWRVGLAVSALAPVVAAALGKDPTGPGILAVMIALLLALRGASALLVGTAVASGYLVAGLSYFGLTDFSGRWPSFVVLGAVVTTAIGAAVRSRADVRAGRLQHERDVHENEELALRNAVTEERVRIARDLHDSIGHGIAVISMHVGAAEVLTPAEETHVHESLRAARLAIRTVLDETEQTVGMLRLPGDTAPIAATGRQGALVDLVDGVRAAGLRVDADVQVSLDALPPAVAAVTYRIVQEMLTNAQRHATSGAAVSLSFGGGGLRIEARNAYDVGDGDETRVGGGNGITGMRERAESLGGRVDVRRVAGDFSVVVELPVERRVVAP